MGGVVSFRGKRLSGFIPEDLQKTFERNRQTTREEMIGLIPFAKQGGPHTFDEHPTVA